MNIEFDYPFGEIKSWVIDHIRNELIEWHHLENSITRAHVIFREDGENHQMKVCEIKIPGFGSELFIHASGESYDEASREMLHKLRDRITERIKGNLEPPDFMTSSVNV
jgi:hypothetical protein